MTNLWKVIKSCCCFLIWQHYFVMCSTDIKAKLYIFHEIVTVLYYKCVISLGAIFLIGEPLDLGEIFFTENVTWDTYLTKLTCVYTLDKYHHFKGLRFIHGHHIYMSICVNSGYILTIYLFANKNSEIFTAAVYKESSLLWPNPFVIQGIYFLQYSKRAPNHWTLKLSHKISVSVSFFQFC